MQLTNKYLGYSSLLCLIAIIFSLFAFGFGVIYSSLTLFLIHSLHYSEADATLLYSVYASWFFTMGVVGGFLGGRLGHKNCVLVGFSLVFMAYIFFYVHFENSILWACALMDVGSGFLISNLMVVIGHAERDQSRMPLHLGYITLYLSINLGALFGAISSGYVGVENYRQLFLCAACLIFISCLLYIFIYPRIAFSPHSHSASQAENSSSLLLLSSFGHFLILLILAIALSWSIENLMQYSSLSNDLVTLMGILCIVGLIFVTELPSFGLSFAERRFLRRYILIISAAVIFWSLYTLEQSLVVSFFDHSVNRKLGHWEVPAVFLGGFNELMDIIVGIILAICLRAGRERSSHQVRAFSAILLMGIAYWVMAFGVYIHRHELLTPIYWVMSAFVIMSLAEMLMGPLVNTIAIEYGPKQLQGFLIGCAQLATGVAGAVSGYLNHWASFDTQAPNSIVLPHMARAFFLYGLLGVLAGGILLIGNAHFKRN